MKNSIEMLNIYKYFGIFDILKLKVKRHENFERSTFWVDFPIYELYVCIRIQIPKKYKVNVYYYSMVAVYYYIKTWLFCRTLAIQH